MSDNTELNLGSGGDTIATDDCAGVKYQQVKLVDGTLNSTTAVAAGNGAAAAAIRVTVASDSTGTVAVTNAGTFAVQAASTLAAETTKVIGTVNIAAAQTLATVTTVAAVTAISNALPAGTNAIGKLAANSGVDIGDVDVTSIIPGTGATNAGKAIDSVAGATDTGVAILAVRDDALTTLTPIDGDYVPLRVSSTGALHVTGSAGTTQYAEDTAVASGDSLVALGTQRQDTLASSTSADGDYAHVKSSSTGAIYVNVAEGGIAGVVEDAAAAGGETGVMILAVRRDSASSGVSADGDFAALSVTSDGSLRVSGSSGTTQYTEDGASAGAEALCLVGAVRRDTAASSSGTDGDYSTLNTDANGRLHTIAALAASQTLATVTTVSTVTNVATIGTSVTPGTAAANLGKAEDAAHASGDVGVMSLSVRQDTAAALAGTNADYQPLITDASGRLHVNVGNTVTVGSHAVTNAGTFATQSVAAGDVAHDAADSGNPVKVGGKAVSAEPTAVTANDRANLITDLVGKLITLPYSNPENFVSGAITTAMTGTTSTSLVAAPAAGLRNYITTIIVSNAHATVGTDVAIQDGSGGTTLLTIPAAAVYGGAAITLPVPLRQPTTATAIYCANVTTGASTKVSAVGYKGA